MLLLKYTKNRILLLIMLLNATNNLHAQIPDWEWATSPTCSSIYGDWPWDISTDLLGNVYVTGAFFSPSLVLGSYTLPNQGNCDMFIIKYNANGNVVWAISAGGNGYESGTSVKIDSLGFIYASGRFSSSSISFGSTTLSNSGVTDMYLIKLDSSGNIIWAKSYGGSDHDQGADISLDNSGHIYLSGSFESSNINFAPFSLVNANNYIQPYFVKMDTSGNINWATTINGNLSNYPVKANSLDSLGNFTVCGSYLSSYLVFGTDTIFNNGLYDGFIVQYNSNGNVNWARSIGSTLTEALSGIYTDSQNNIVCTGFFDSDSLIFGGNTLLNSGSRAVLIAKFDPYGNEIWIKSVNCSGVSLGHGIACDSNDNIYVAGFYENASIIFNQLTFNNSGSSDIFVAKYDQYGNHLWGIVNGSSGLERGGWMTCDNSNNIYVANYFDSPSLIMGTSTVYNPIGQSILISKLNYTTSLEENPSNKFIEIFPTVSADYFTISTIISLENAILLIYDLNGKLVFHKSDLANHYSFSISELLHSGLYLAKIIQNDQILLEEKIILIE